MFGRLLSLFVLLTCIGGLTASATPLDDYVAKPDPAYAYTAVPGSDVSTPAYDAKVYHLVSQTWLDETKVDRTKWEHWVTVFVPKDRQYTPALLMINGGSNRGGEPQAPDRSLAQIAVQTKSIVVDVKQIPNQPLKFTGEHMDKYKESGRSEDAMITYGWDKFLNGEDAEWLARLPMTKAIVRAMDLVQAEHGDVESFFVIGGSKRGWTTWTVAAVDKRVMGIGPAVIDVLNFIPSLDNHHGAYGFWAPAVHDYEEMGIMARLHTPRMKELLAIVEPYSYIDRLTMPKYIVNSAGDQFFTPDSSKFYFDDLQGEKHLRYMANTDHGLSIEAFVNLSSFYSAILSGTPRPDYTWSIGADGAIEATCVTAPESVVVWSAHNPAARDFRLENIGKAWTSEALEGDGGRYRFAPSAPAEGYSAHFIEMRFPNPSFSSPFVFTTGVSIVPDTYPGLEQAAGK